MVYGMDHRPFVTAISLITLGLTLSMISFCLAFISYHEIMVVWFALASAACGLGGVVSLCIGTIGLAITYMESKN